MSGERVHRGGGHWRPPPHSECGDGGPRGGGDTRSGVAEREDFAGEAGDCDHRIGEPHEEDATPEGCAANDVFIVEGEQERYGDKSAWEVVRRY